MFVEKLPLLCYCSSEFDLMILSGNQNIQCKIHWNWIYYTNFYVKTTKYLFIMTHSAFLFINGSEWCNYSICNYNNPNHTASSFVSYPSRHSIWTLTFSPVGLNLHISTHTQYNYGITIIRLLEISITNKTSKIGNKK